ncbi:MAG: 2OG-Fe dioxygenase family protein [Mizugakiibacter sp.]|uniref:2OG-Fe dioxygenase family protein n=1 Tax=Mizugakiibacter sp. TaxID=1972610 RepID=UPI0027F6D23B|nr:2OG-Fe dioxygenase family protein [Actinomycetes bacterium]
MDTTRHDGLHATLLADGFAFVPAARMRARLEAHGALADGDAFAASWDALEPDTYMADHGRYRRRRHAVFAADAGGAIARQPHQPHYQSREYNPLNGGVERWFAPIEDAIGAGATLRAVLAYCRALFGGLAPEVRRWHIEVHQFRIEARAGEPGLPTPEGVHRDGVDYVLVLLVRRRNIASGTTTIHAPGGAALGSFTLADPFDAALVDDRRVFHGVTAVQPLDAAQPACRDVLVVTFRRA